MTREFLPSHLALAAFALSIAPLCLRAQATAPAAMADHQMAFVDQIPPDRLPPPRRMTGVGNAHITITANADAQRWFDQGLNLFHDYWDYESARAFEQAIRVDPDCAMCYWGLSEAEGFFHSNSQAYAAPALEKAVSLAGRTSEHEQLYITATAAGFRESANIWRTLADRFPEDREAQIFMSMTAQPDRTSTEILERVMAVDPKNAAANHYYIHALEATDHPERALPSAERLASLAPSAGHIVHMPGHIFFRVGDYARAEQAFAASQRVDKRYMRAQHVDPDNDWNYVHNLMYAVANLMEEGKLTRASSLSLKLNGARGDLESTLYVYSTRDSISRLDPRLPVALRTANWSEAVTLIGDRRAQAEHPNLEFLATQLTDLARGMLAIAARDFTAGSRYASSVDRALEAARMPSPGSPPALLQTPTSPRPQSAVRPDALLPPILSTLGIMALELRGSLLVAHGEIRDGIAAFDQAAKQQQALGYREPPIYIRPVREAEGAALLAAGDWDDARRAYEAALVERPRSGFALYGVAACSELQGDRNAAVEDYTAFLRAWKDADGTRPEVVHARAFLAADGRAPGTSRFATNSLTKRRSTSPQRVYR